jgi:hypothetical protein
MSISTAVIILLGTMFLFSALLVSSKISFDISNVANAAMFSALMVWIVMLPATAAFAVVLGAIFVFVRSPRAILIVSIAVGLAIGAIALADMSYTNPGKLALHRAWWSAALVVFSLPISACICWWISRRCWRGEGAAQ